MRVTSATAHAERGESAWQPGAGGGWAAAAASGGTQQAGVGDVPAQTPAGVGTSSPESVHDMHVDDGGCDYGDASDDWGAGDGRGDVPADDDHAMSGGSQRGGSVGTVVEAASAGAPPVRRRLPCLSMCACQRRGVQRVHGPSATAPAAKGQHATGAPSLAARAGARVCARWRLAPVQNLTGLARAARVQSLHERTVLTEGACVCADRQRRRGRRAQRSLVAAGRPQRRRAAGTAVVGTAGVLALPRAPGGP